MRRLHFFGSGGAGMAPLARISLQRGDRVTGADAEWNGRTAELEKLGARLTAESELPEGTDRVIYTSALGAEHPGLRLARARGVPCLRRGEFLAEVAGEYRRVAAVSGSHGKTSITAMLSFILRRSGIDAGYLVGGTLADGPSGEAGDGDIFVTEADESDGTHTLLHPALGIVPNAEDDHAWSVGGADALRKNFAQFAAQSERLLVYGAGGARELAAGHPAAETITLPLTEFPGYLGIDAALAVRAAELLGVRREAALEALRNWHGVERRMSVRYAGGAVTVIEDYAHHPTELRAALATLRARYPGYFLHVVFQPHRYARLARYFDEFAAILRGGADAVTILPVFAAWSESGRPGAEDLARAAGADFSADFRVGLRAERPLLTAVIGAGDSPRALPWLIAQAEQFSKDPGGQK